MNSVLTIHVNKLLSTIEPEIYGHFSEHLGRCIYEGIYVGEDSEIPNINGMRTDVVEALKELEVPVLRWPGGCFADEYHWKDGIGPKEGRKKMVNTNWGGVVEDNSFGTHEFMELCRQLGCKTYINGNLGSGTVQEMSEWVEYMTFDGISPMAELRAANGHEKPWKVDYFGVGNENWGCGGNMRPEHYAQEYRRYQTFVRNYDWNNPIAKVCCGANADDYNWTEKVLEGTFNTNGVDTWHVDMSQLSLHYYTMCGDWSNKSKATDFTEEQWYETMNKALHLDEIITKHSEIMDKYDPKKDVGMAVDEWGTWYEVEPGTNPGFLYQQNTMRDALVAGLSLNILNKHSDRVRMACIAQIVNVLQAMVLTEGDKMIKTPTYHVFNMYKAHKGATLLESKLEELGEVGSPQWKVPQVSESVSYKDGEVFITLCNLSATEEATVEIDLTDAKIENGMPSEYYVIEGTMVCAEKINDHNTFDDPYRVVEDDFVEYEELEPCHIVVSLPAASVVTLLLGNN